MLRESSKAIKGTLDLAGIPDITVDTGVDEAATIIALTDSVVLADVEELEIARSGLTERLGVAGTVRLIAVAANFKMMNIIMDSLGTPPSENYAVLADQAGLGQTLG